MWIVVITAAISYVIVPFFSRWVRYTLYIFFPCFSLLYFLFCLLFHFFLVNYSFHLLVLKEKSQIISCDFTLNLCVHLSLIFPLQYSVSSSHFCQPHSWKIIIQLVVISTVSTFSTLQYLQFINTRFSPHYQQSLSKALIFLTFAFCEHAV